jgi:hypothetical protein
MIVTQRYILYIYGRSSLTVDYRAPWLSAVVVTTAFAIVKSCRRVMSGTRLLAICRVAENYSVGVTVLFGHLIGGSLGPFAVALFVPCIGRLGLGESTEQGIFIMAVMLAIMRSSMSEAEVVKVAGLRNSLTQVGVTLVACL